MQGIEVCKMQQYYSQGHRWCSLEQLSSNLSSPNPNSRLLQVRAISIVCLYCHRFCSLLINVCSETCSMELTEKRCICLWEVIVCRN